MSKKSPKRRVVVTGYGMVTPLGRNAEETFNKACKGVSGIDYITSFDTQGLPCRIGGQIDDTWLPGIDDRTMQRFDNISSRGLRLMRVATIEAARQSRLEEIQRLKEENEMLIKTSIRNAARSDENHLQAKKLGEDVRVLQTRLKEKK